jgi:hypothetical protein
MVVYRRILKRNKLVYLLVAPKPKKYTHGRSRIFYIGTTKKGADRMAVSAAHRAEEILESRGVKLMSVHTVSCTAIPGFKGWHFLEDALLAAFKLKHGELPSCNDRGKKLQWNDKFEKRLKLRAMNRILEEFSR